MTPKNRWSWAEAVMRACASGELEDRREGCSRRVHKRAMVAVANAFALCFAGDETLTAWPGAAALAPLCGLSQKQVEHALAALDAAGWFVEVGRVGRATKRRLNVPGEADLRPESDTDARSESSGPEVRIALDRNGPTVPAKRTYGPAEADLRSDQPRQEPRQEPQQQAAAVLLSLDWTQPPPLTEPLMAIAEAELTKVKAAQGKPVKSPEGFFRAARAKWASDPSGEYRRLIEGALAAHKASEGARRRQEALERAERERAGDLDRLHREVTGGRGRFTASLEAATRRLSDASKSPEQKRSRKPRRSAS